MTSISGIKCTRKWMQQCTQYKVMMTNIIYVIFQIFGSNYIIQDIELSKKLEILVCVTRILCVQTNKGGVS